MKAVLYFAIFVILLIGSAVLYEWSLSEVSPTVVEVEVVPQEAEEETSTATTTPRFATLNTAYEVGGATIVLTEIIEDSRCPADVVCIQAGTVRVRGLLSDPNGSSERTFVLGEPVSFSGRTIVLSEVLPYAISNASIQKNEYQFYFTIDRE